MATFPSTEELTSMFLTNMENSLNQNSPQYDKAFLKVLAASEAMLAQSIFKAAIVEAKQNLATTAYRSGLIEIGSNYNVPVKPAVATRLKILSYSEGTTPITVNTIFIGDINGASYRVVSSEYDGGSMQTTAEIIAVIPGEASNMSVGELLTMSENIPGVTSQTAEVTEILEDGVEEEDTEDYRIRVLDEQRSVGGGANSADYRRWGQSVIGAERVYPYSGLQGNIGVGLGYRTVFVKADETVNPTGVAPQELLDEVEQAILFTPDGFDQLPLGTPATGLTVQSISTQNFYVTVEGISIPDPGQLDDLKAKIESNVQEYFDTREPWIDGLDVLGDKRDTITRISISEAVQGALAIYGAWATDVLFSITPGSSMDSYILNAGELPILGLVTYV